MPPQGMSPEEIEKRYGPHYSAYAKGTEVIGSAEYRAERLFYEGNQGKLTWGRIIPTKRGVIKAIKEAEAAVRMETWKEAMNGVNVKEMMRAALSTVSLEDGNRILVSMLKEQMTPPVKPTNPPSQLIREGDIPKNE